MYFFHFILFPLISGILKVLDQSAILQWTDIMPKYITLVTHRDKNLSIAKMNVNLYNVQRFISLHSVVQYSDDTIFGLVSSMKSASVMILVLMTSVYASPIQRRELEEMASKSKLPLVAENAFSHIILTFSTKFVA